MEHPSTPPPELVEKWIEEIWHEGSPVRVAASDIHIATQAANWGADQELEAVLHWLRTDPGLCRLAPRYINNLCRGLRAARRPKPLSLKQQALEALDGIQTYDAYGHQITPDLTTIRRALEALPD